VNKDVHKILHVENLSKKFFLNPALGMRPGAMELMKLMLGFNSGPKELTSNEFWAIKDVSFELNRGEAIGIMGMNGAGKSTLLKILLGRLSPDEGNYKVSGSIGGLVELGAGFHPEMSGVENIFNKARLLGVKESEIKERLNEIIDFADLGDFIDSPVKTYSSGMNVRLGFAIAIHFVDDLVLCDEILAVGDFDFRQKCLAKINELKNYKSFVLVSHNPRDISTFCSKAILLHKGEVVAEGIPEKVIEAYAQCSHHISATAVRKRINAAVQFDDRSEKKVKTLITERKRFFYENLDFKNELVSWIHSRGNGEVSFNRNRLEYYGTTGSFTLRQELDRVCDTRIEFDLKIQSGSLELVGNRGGGFKALDSWNEGFSGSVVIECVSNCIWFLSKDLSKFSNGLRFDVKNLKVKQDVKIKSSSREEKEYPDLTHDSKLSLFGAEFHRNEVVKSVKVHWNLRKREGGYYYVSGDLFVLRVSYELTRDVSSLRVGIPFFRLNGEMILGPDSRNNPQKEILLTKGKHVVEMILDPLPVNDGRLWMTVTLCEDPAHLYRKHTSFFDVINPGQEYGVVKAFPIWGKNMNLNNLAQII